MDSADNPGIVGDAVGLGGVALGRGQVAQMAATAVGRCGPGRGRVAQMAATAVGRCGPGRGRVAASSEAALTVGCGGGALGRGRGEVPDVVFAADDSEVVSDTEAALGRASGRGWGFGASLSTGHVRGEGRAPLRGRGLRGRAPVAALRRGRGRGHGRVGGGRGRGRGEDVQGRGPPPAQAVRESPEDKWWDSYWDLQELYESVE